MIFPHSFIPPRVLETTVVGRLHVQSSSSQLQIQKKKSYGPNFAGIHLLFGRKKKFFSKSPSKPMNKKVPLLLVRLLDPHGSLHKPQFLTVGGNLIFQPIVDHCSWSNPIQPYHPPCPIKDHMCFFIAANDEWHSPISGVFSSLNPRVGGELYNLPSVPI